MGQGLGMSHDNKRDLYKDTGYPKELLIQHYQDAYDRGDIAKTVVTAYPVACWKRDPVLRDRLLSASSDTSPSAFETAWLELALQLPTLYANLLRADKLAGIGQFGVVVLGFDDGLALSQPVVPSPDRKLLYVRPLSQSFVSITQYEKNTTSPRYGLPTEYNINFISPTTQLSSSYVPGSVSSSKSENVHWTRVLHIAENLESSNVLGTPRLQVPYNRLFDCQKVLASSAEMFWQGAFRGFAFKLDSEAQLTTAAGTEMKEEIDKYVHGLQRYLRLQGVDVQDMSGTITGPDEHIRVQLQFISAFTRIPIRILLGSERGELSSSQDERAWRDQVQERRDKFVGPMILHSLVDLLVGAGVMPQPNKETFRVEWPHGSELTPMEQADLAVKQTAALSQYVSSGLDAIIAPIDYLVGILHMEQHIAEKLVNNDVEDLLEKLRDETQTPGPDGSVEAGAPRPGSTTGKLRPQDAVRNKHADSCACSECAPEFTL